MSYSVSEISNSLDKGSVYEGMSMFRASLEDETSRLADGVKPEAISNEKIQKDDNILGTYLVVSNAIHGGMGSVWRVHHKSWNVDLAMKRPQPKFFAEGSEKRKESFVQECESWIDLGLHPNIVSCYYVRSIGGVPSIFSEWMNGGSLKDRIKDGSLYKGDTGEQQERLLDIAIQTARGLRYSHSKNLLHMDVKPGNILLTAEGDVKLSDFGLARARGNLTRGTAQAVSGYTAEYCPDAQKTSGDPSPWMDGFAWAVTILELYAGERRWKTGQEAFKRLDEITRDTRVPVPRDLYDLFKRCFSFSKKSLFRKKDDSHLFDGIEDTLLRIYASATGKEYQRPNPDVLSDTAGTRNNTALSYYDLGRADTACELIDKAYESDPEDPSVVYNRNLLLFRQKKIRCQDAVRTLAAAISKTGNNRDAFYYLRMCMEPGICFAVDEFKEMAEKAGSVLIRSEEERALLEHAEKVCSEAVAEEDQIYDLLGRDFFVERNTGYEGDVDKEICYNEASGRFYICFTGKSVVTGLFDRSAGQLSDIEEFPIPDVLSCLAVSPGGKYLLITVKGSKDRNKDQSKEPVIYDVSSERRAALTGLPEGLCLSRTVCFDESGQSFYVVLYKKHGPKGVIKNGVYYAEIGPEADKICYIAEFDLTGRYISTVTSREPGNVKYNPKGISISGIKSAGSRLFLFRNEKIPSETQFYNSAYLGIYDKKDSSYSENKKAYNGIMAVSDDGSLAAAAGTGDLAILETGSLEEVCCLDFSKDSPPSVVGDLLVNRLYRFRLRRGNGLYGAGSHRTFIPKQSLTPGAGLFIKQIRSYEEMSASEEEFRTLMQQAERRMQDDPAKALELIGRARTVEGYENNIQALDLQQRCMAALKKDHPLVIRALMLRAEMEEQKGKDSFSWRNAAFDRKGGRIAYYTGSALVVRSLPGLQEIFRIADARPRFYDRKSIAFSPDGNTLFAGDVSRKAALYDRSGKVIWTEEYSNMVTNASFSSDGQYIMATFSAASEDPLSAALISAKDGKILSRISDHRARFEALFINRDSEFVWVAQNGPSSGDFEFRSVPGLELIETMKAWTNISKPMSFNDGGDIFGLGAGHYGYINLLRRSEKKLTKYTETLPYTGAYDMADGGKLLAYYDHSGEVVIEETDGDRIARELFRLEAKEGAADLYFTDDCRYLLVLIGGAALRCYELDWGL